MNIADTHIADVVAVAYPREEAVAYFGHAI